MTSATEDMSPTENDENVPVVNWFDKLNITLDQDTNQEIDDMLQAIPELKSYFVVMDKIGSGTFSSVYVARLKDRDDIQELFALKYIIPTSHPSRIENELSCLCQIGGYEHNVMDVKCCVRHRDHVVIVMPYFPHQNFVEYVSGGLSVTEVRRYMYNLLKALRHVHSKDMIHRDVKPSNFLFNQKLNKYSLVDFGLAQKYSGSKESATAIDRYPKSNQRKTRSHAHDQETKTETTPQISPKKRRVSVDNKEQEPKETKQNILKSPAAEVSLKEIQNITNTAVDQLDLKKQQRNVTVKESAKQSTSKENTVASPRTTRPQPPHRLHSPRRNILEKHTQQKLRTNTPAPSADKVKHTTVVVKKNGKQMYKSVPVSSCQCYGRMSVCTVCNSRSGQHAARAGTPGFRAPEVLLKHPHQTTALDIWSAGVIFLSLLSWRYPFFKAQDDINYLGQIMAVFGLEQMREMAKSIGKNLVTREHFSHISLESMCEQLRQNTLVPFKVFSKIAQDKNIDVPVSGEVWSEEEMLQCNRILLDDGDWHCVPESAYDLLDRLLDLNPNTRITAEQAMTHEFFNDM